MEFFCGNSHCTWVESLTIWKLEELATGTLILCEPLCPLELWGIWSPLVLCRLLYRIWLAGNVTVISSCHTKYLFHHFLVTLMIFCCFPQFLVKRKLTGCEENKRFWEKLYFKAFRSRKKTASLFVIVIFSHCYHIFLQ